MIVYLFIECLSITFKPWLTVLGGANRVYLVIDGVNLSISETKIMAIQVFNWSWMSKPKKITVRIWTGTVFRNFHILFGLVHDQISPVNDPEHWSKFCPKSNDLVYGPKFRSEVPVRNSVIRPVTEVLVRIFRSGLRWAPVDQVAFVHSTLIQSFYSFLFGHFLFKHKLCCIIVRPW